MPFLFIYLLKLSLSLTVVFLFYHFVLRKLTFYNWNRWYLLGYTLLSFFIPFIDISTVLKEQNWSGKSIVEWVPVLQQSAVTVQENTGGTYFSPLNFISLIIAGGMLVMFTRLLVQLISFQRLVRKAKPLDTGSIPGSGMKLYQVEADIIPFSFGNSIFINYHLHTREELREIVWHEFIHVKQKHSLDIIYGELLCLLNWYNPFAWLLRSSIRQNLEFIADNKVLENGVGRKEYQYLLLKVIGNNHFSIAPKFNFSSLKKRIAMMNKMKSAGVHIVKFLFILPMIAVLLLAFRNQYERKQQGAGISPSTQDTLPATKRIIKKMPAEIASISVMETNDAAVSDPIKQKVQGMVVVKRKDGTKEVYDLDSKESLDAFEKKYGVKLEDILPPPPPPPPIPPAESVPVIAPVPPTPPVPAVGSTEAVAPVTPVPPVKNTGIDLSGISREYEITDKKAWIKLLDGTVENYDLTNKKEKEAFEKKYGKIIHVNVNANVNANVYAKVNANVNANVNSNPNTTIKTNVNTNINNDLRKTVELSSDAVTTRPVRAISTTPAAARNSNLRSMVSPAVLYTTPAPPSSGDPINDYGYTITGKEDIVITITKNSTRQDLDKFIVQMKEKGVELSFDETEYNSKGQLVSINGTMKSGGSQSNFVATDFERLVLAMIRKGDKIYFKVSTRDSKTVI